MALWRVREPYVMTARRLAEAERYLRSGRWKTWSPMLLT
jgi:hypothetical protein